MKAISKTVLALASVLLLAGCIETATLVTVRPDGTGTVEQTVLLSNSFAQLMQQTSGAGGGQQQKPEQQKEPDPINEEALKAKAETMGETVTFVSARPVKTEKGSGYVALYKFQDINRLGLDQSPSVEGLAPQGGGNKEGRDDLVTFQFTPGNPATLLINNPQSKPAAEGQKSEGEKREATPQDPEMLKMMRQIYQDMRVSMVVEIQGTIVDTNATHRKGSRITLMDLDFGKLLEDEERFKALAEAEPKTMSETKALLKDVRGLELELNEQVRVRLR